MGTQKPDAGHVNKHIFLYYILLVFTYESLLFLYLLILNPLFPNRPALAAIFLVAIPPLFGGVLTASTRVIDLILSSERTGFSISKIVMRITLLAFFFIAMILTLTTLSFPPPVKNRWILALLPVLILVTIILWRLSSRIVSGARSSAEITGKNPFKSIVFTSTLILLVAIAWSLIAPSVLKDRTRMILFGIDGGTWKIVERMMNQGELPNISRMVREGCSGRLASIKPCISPAVWTSISTGFLPQSHGITNFYGTLNQVKKKGFWEILSEEGERVGLLRWLITWPPVEVNGFIIPNWLARDSECYPNTLSHIKRKGGQSGILKVRDVLLDISYGLTMEAVTEVIHYKVRKAITEPSPIDRNIAIEKIDVIRRRDYFIRLKHLFDIDFGSCTFDNVDNFSHILWKFMEPEKFNDVPAELVNRYGGVIEDQYREIDECIGHITSTVDDDTYLMVVSDHGFKAADTIRVHPPNPTTAVLDYLRVPKDLIRLLDLKFDRMVLGVKKGKGSVEIARDLKSQLLSVVFEGETEPLLKVITLKKAFDKYQAVIVIRAREGLTYSKDRTVILPTGRRPFQDIFTPRPGYSGFHDPDDGLFILSGPGVKTGVKVEGISVLDIQPIILHLFGKAVPLDIDGRLRMDIFDESEVSPPRYIQTYGERAVVEQEEVPLGEEALDRMKALGYIE